MLQTKKICSAIGGMVLGSALDKMWNVFTLPIALSTCIRTLAMRRVSSISDSLNCSLNFNGGMLRDTPFGCKRSAIKNPLSAMIESPGSSLSRIPCTLVDQRWYETYSTRRRYAYQRLEGVVVFVIYAPCIRIVFPETSWHIKIYLISWWPYISTSLNLWYRRLIQVMKIQDTDDWDILNLNAKSSSIKLRRTNSSSDTSERGAPALDLLLL